LTGTKSKLIALLLLPLALYLCLYTINRRTGFLDSLATLTGLEVVGWIVAPADWVQQTSEDLWQDYIALVRVRRENERLKQRIHELKIQQMRLRSRAAEAERLRDLLGFSPPPGWSCTGARIVGERMSPPDVLQTVLLNKGSTDAVHPGMPALTPTGLVGQVLKTSPHFSKLLLLTDPNSKVPVIGRQSRTKAILKGRGTSNAPQLDYVTRNTPLSKGEIVVTSGLGGVYPKGIPVGRIQGIEQPGHSLFQEVQAELLSDPSGLEEVLLLRRSARQRPKDSVIDPAALLRRD
jgi:rod shape-determining protein MreC